MRTLIIDNYDSFTYNLLHLVEQCTEFVEVRRNDSIELSELISYDKIIISPGPGLPDDAGISNEAIRLFADKKDMLGVCLGMQCIAEVFGGQLMNLNDVLHGVSSRCKVEPKSRLFNGFPDEIQIGHYHSWVVDPESLSASFDISAINEENLTMAIEHKNLNLCGVQFHPESVLTPMGLEIIKNWMKSDGR